MSDVVNIDIVSRLKQAAETKAAADPALVRRLLLPGAGLLGLGAGAILAHGPSDEDVARTRNTSFGAGVATGMAGPRIIDALHAAMHPQPAPTQEPLQ